MQISDLLTGLAKNDDDVEIVDERSPALKATEAHLAGLGRLKSGLTPGQHRRAAVRRRLAEARKGHKADLRLFVKNRRARAALEGQLDVLGKTSPIGQAYLARILTERYGSVADAIAHADSIGLTVNQGARDYAASVAD